MKDKELIYNLITLMRITGKQRTGTDRNLMLGSANIMEWLIRKILELEEEKAAKEKT